MPAIYHEGSWLGNATDPEVLVKDTVGWTGKNRAYSQTNNAVIAHIENGITYDVSWTGSATVTLKKNSASGATITSGSTSPLSFTADADYELYFGSSATVTNIMVKDSRITDPTYEPYHESVEEEIEQIYADNGVLGAKNLLPYPYAETTLTRGGITFTVNSDCSVTANGTATADTRFQLALQGKFTLPSGEYILTDGTSSSAATTYIIDVAPYKNGAWIRKQYNTVNGVRRFTLNSSEYDGINIYIQIRSGTTVNNLVFKPMLRLASDPDDTYQPPAMTNRELTDTKVGKAKTATEAKTTVFSESSKVSSCTAVLNDILCALRITSTARASVSGAWTTIATLNDAYKPANLVYEAAIDDTGVPIGWTRIHADGKVEVYQNSGSAKTVNISSLYLRA